MKTYECTKSPEEVVKKALFKAWKACGSPFGMGIFQDNPGADEEDVWNNVKNSGDYPGSFKDSKAGVINADYVFGRMMKLYLTYNQDSINFSDKAPSPNYQDWSRLYPSYKELLESAESEIE